MITTNNISFDECIKVLKKHEEYQRQRIDWLVQENNKVKEDTYKNEELKKLQERVEELERENRRGFPISDEEQEDINEWITRHEREVHGAVTVQDRMKLAGAIGGGYTYKFIPTSIGTIGYITCTCGCEYCFSDL